MIGTAIRGSAVALLVIAVTACAQQAATTGTRSETLRRIAGPAGTLVVDDGGRGGVPVVFVHSYAGSKAHWSAQLRHLRQRQRAVAFDARGHGESSPPAGNVYSSDALAADIAAVVDALRLDRFVLVGHSMGGAAAIAYAATHPQRVAGLVLVGAPGKVPPEQASKIVASLEADYANVMEKYWDELLTGARPEVRAQLVRERETIGRDASLAIIKALFADDPVVRLRRYSGPTLIVVTSGGDQPQDLQNLFPQLPRAKIDGTSHWPHLDKPETFNRVLDDFLANVQSKVQ